MDNPPKHCIWLTFESAPLESIIHNLSEEYNTPIFQPHCTIIGRTEINVVQLKAAIVTIAERLNMNYLTVDEIESRDDYWMGFYLTIQEKQQIIEMHKQILYELNIKDHYSFFPHISLMYSKLSLNDKKKIIIPIDKGEVINVRSLQVTECSEKVENWKPVFELKIQD